MKHLLNILLTVITMSAFAQLSPVTSTVIHWNDLVVKKNSLRETRRLAEGTTNEFEYFEIHATTLEKGALPKPAHTQKDIEELIIIKEGSMKCSIGNKTAILGAGSVLLIPPLESQSIQNSGDGPLTYYVLKFRSKKPMNMKRSIAAGGALLLNADSLEFKETEKGGRQGYFNRPTAMCDNYEMHITMLSHKGPSHNPHQHLDTEIILVIEGDVAMTIDGKDYSGTPGDLFFIESGKFHGVSNAAEKPCSYFAFKWR